MSKNEKITDFFISKLLDAAEIDFVPNGSNINEIQKALKTASKKGTGKVGFPEFTAKSGDFILVIEDKEGIENQANYEDDEETLLAMDTKSVSNYAENGAVHYAKKIVEDTNFKKVFAFGCTGNEKHHHIRPIFVDGKNYKLLQPVENFENFSEENIEKYYREQVLEETPKETLELEEVLRKSSELHEALRNYGQLGDSEKPLVVSAILLALSDDNFKTESLTGDAIRTDGQKIFTSLDDYMKRVKVTPDTKKEKVLNQFNIIKDRPLLSEFDQRLGKTPLRYFTEFLETYVLEAIKANTKEDVLGRFYGQFIRYSGGDGQTLGVVLTPGHITELFCDLVQIKPDDRVFDPCCGTGGFLISAMHKMLEEAKDDEPETIKKNQLHGIEIREDMFSIATTNMILRGDGKSNLENKDFLKQAADDLRKKNFSVGFINPPYSQAKGADTAYLSEIHFIEHLLDGLADGARCAAIVPQSTMVGKRKEDKQAKKRILEKHTLEGVISLNKETFYGVGTVPCIAVFTAHKPHPEQKYCKFINFEDDGFTVRKHLGLVETERAKERKKHLLDCWIYDAPAETKFMVKTTVEPDDEWLHPFYYFNDVIPKDEDFELTIADFLTFEFNMIAQGKGYLFEESEQKKSYIETIPLTEKDWGEFEIEKLFYIKSGTRLTKADMKRGKKPFIGATDSNNGITEFVSNTNDSEDSNVLGVNYNGSVVENFYHPYKAIFTDDVKRLAFKDIEGNKFLYLFIKTAILKQKSKYQYGYKFNGARMSKQKIMLPINENKTPDYEYMENYMKRLEYLKLTEYLEKKNISI